MATDLPLPATDVSRQSACDSNTVRLPLRRAWPLRKRVVVLIMEIALAALSYALAVYIIQEEEGKQWALRVLKQTLPYLLAIRLASLFCFGLFKRSFRYASIPDLISVSKAASLSSLVYFAVVRTGLTGLHLPIALLILDWALLQFFWGGLHFGMRVFTVQRAIRRKVGKRVIIAGAGDAGVSVLKELVLDSAFRPVAVVDDDPEKRSNTICGVPVLGSTQELARVARETRAEEVLICIPSATRSQMSRILLACRQCAIPVRTLPSLAELMKGSVTRRDFRSVRVEDVLQREEVPLDAGEIRELVCDRIVLVTGAAGSIGSELSRQVAAACPRTLLLLDKSENGLFYIHRELRERSSGLQLKPLFVDVARRNLVEDALRNEAPDIVFHAAAHKHVGLLELYPHEAIRNNVIGTRNIALAALQSKVSRLVNISSDKAVNPRSYMGFSKKLTELCIQELARHNTSTRFMNVRFGNVAGSTGSVLRLFWEQAQNGGPLRVTDPRASRYFMTVPEAVYLILRAAIQGQGGETFVFEMGEPINIYELAKTVSLFAGFAPGKDLPIQFVGLTKGEKISEELWEEWEQPRRTAQNGILVVTKSNPLCSGILQKIELLETYLSRDDREGLLTYLDRLDPSFAANRQPPRAPYGEVRKAQAAPTAGSA
jgi:FlaA1/EpsC-like NDP-sugar epimerase